VDILICRVGCIVANKCPASSNGRRGGAYCKVVETVAVEVEVTAVEVEAMADVNLMFLLYLF